MNSTAFSWNGLPQYAARLIAAAVRVHGTPCPVLPLACLNYLREGRRNAELWKVVPPSLTYE